MFEVALDTPTVEAYGLRVVPHQCRRTSIECRLVSREPDEFVRRGESDGRDGEESSSMTSRLSSKPAHVSSTASRQGSRRSTVALLAAGAGARSSSC